MKKKILFRILLGGPIGIVISFVITVAISLAVNDGNYYPVEPELVVDFGNELNAVIVQALCALIYGAAFGGASAIWEVERWSPLRMTVTHLLVISLVTLPVAYFMRWMERSLSGIALYCGIFFGVYLFVWLVQYWPMKKRIQQINQKLKEGA